MKIKDLSTNHNAWLNETTLGKQLAEAPKAMVNFGAEDLKNLEQIRDLPTLKAQALSLISKPSAKPMKPEKVEWFKNALDSMNSPMKVIKLMYDLLLSGEGNSVVGSRNSMNPNSYRQRFGEEGVAEGQGKFVVWYMIDDGNWDEHGTFNNEAEASAYIGQLAAKGYDDDNFEVTKAGEHPDDNYTYSKGVEEGMLDNPGEPDSPVASAITRRILMQRTDLLAKHGPVRVGQAIDDVADWVGDVDEIGSSDVSAWVKQVEQALGQ
jgi:hypothetical protein